MRQCLQANILVSILVAGESSALTIVQMHAFEILESDDPLKLLHRLLVSLFCTEVVSSGKCMTWASESDQRWCWLREVLYVQVSMHTPTRSLFSTCLIISANSSKVEPRTLPAPALQ
jgi:hypothetical protein